MTTPPNQRLDIVRAHRAVAVWPRPLKLIASSNSPMSTPISMSRSIALSYAILAAMYLGIIAILANSLCVGSLRRLWQDAHEFSSTLVLLFALFAIHAAMSVLSLRYTRPVRAGV